ncbi:MAG: hypothetical protein M3Y22_13235, partial [Pseudomonadota bacterium]|nr:hypothetical protein [Pseudomonadota bacterium]
AEICRRHDISSGQLSTWRQQCRTSAWGNAGAVVPIFAKAMVAPPDPSPEAVPPASDPPLLRTPRRRSRSRATSGAQIEIALPDGAVVRVGAAVDQAALSRVLSGLRGQ